MDAAILLSRTEALLRDHLCQDALVMAVNRSETYPGDLDARLAQAQALMGLERFADARVILLELREALQRLAPVYRCLGDISRRQGLSDEADAYERIFRALRPDTPAQAREDGEGQPVDDGETYDAIEDVATDFRTLTLADLYIRQGHLALARDLLEEICLRDPSDADASARLREVRERLPGDPGGPAGLIAELTRWLENIDRLKHPSRVS